MSHQCKSLPGLYEQVEVRQNRFLVRITEIQMFKVNFALQTRHIQFFILDHIRVGIDQGEDTFRGGKSALDLRPKRSEIQNGEEELVEAHDEEIPCADADHPLPRAHAADIHQHADEDAANGIEHRKDQRKDESTLDVDVIGLLV